MRVGEQPVLALIVHDDPADRDNLRHLAWWAAEEQLYTSTHVLNSTFSSHGKKPDEIMRRLSLSGNSSVEVEDVFDLQESWAQRNHALKIARSFARSNPLLHFMHSSTVPRMFSCDRAPDVLRATQQDIPRLVGGLVCNTGEGHMPENYEMISSERDPFKNRTIHEIVGDIDRAARGDGSFAATYPIEWGHPFNVAIPYNALIRVGGFPNEEDSSRKLSRRLSAQGVPSVLSPLIAMHIARGKSDAVTHTRFAEFADAEDAAEQATRRRAAEAIRTIAAASFLARPGQIRGVGRGRRRRHSDNP